MWEEINNSLPPSTTMGIVASEQLPPGAGESWAKWKCLNRLRTGVGRAKVTLSKWGYRHDPTTHRTISKRSTSELRPAP